MFNLISPSQHKFYRAKIDSFVGNLKAYNSDLFKIFEFHNEGVFILAKKNPSQIQGGALLLQKNISSLHPLLQSRFSHDIPAPQKVWVATIYLHFHEDIQGHNFESLCKLFYRKLQESLIEFGIRKKTPCLYLILDSCEHLSTELISSWSYKAQVRPRDSSDGLFHGVLTLTDTQDHPKDLAA